MPKVVPPGEPKQQRWEVLLVYDIADASTMAVVLELFPIGTRRRAAWAHPAVLSD